jgi:hypothetical protein
MKKQKQQTISQLSRASKSTRESVSKWLDDAGLKFTTRRNSKLYDADEALAVIKERQKEVVESSEDSPFRAKAAEEVKRLKRENRIAEMLERRDYMKTDDVEKVIMLIVTRLELIPVKMASEFSLPKNQSDRLQQLLDEARTDAANAIEAMGEK